MAPQAPRPHRRARAVVALAALAACVALGTLPASAGKPPHAGRPTTTKPAPTTTTTSATTTSTSPSTTTTIAPTTTTSTAPSTTTTTVPSAPCGPTIAKADGTAWQCTFADDFDGTALDRTKWVPQETATSSFGQGGECFVDDPDNVAVQGGTLRLTVRDEGTPFLCEDPQGDYWSRYTSGSVSTYQRFSQAFGRFEIRARMPHVTVPGLQEAIWLWPDDPLKYGPWPHSGEIDIAEVYHQHHDRAIPYLHYVPNPWWDPTVTNNYCLVEDVWEYHTYVAEWTEERITISFDGEVCLDHVINPSWPLTAPQPFDHPFMVALTQALGVGANAIQPGVTPLPATMEVDHVRVWR